jgi:hypothetical protein
LIAIGYINPAQIHIILPEVNVIIEHFSNVWTLTAADQISCTISHRISEIIQWT